MQVHTKGHFDQKNGWSKSSRVLLREEPGMIHTLLVFAAVIGVVWLILVIFVKVGSILIKLLCILILIALGWWLLSFLPSLTHTLHP
jgi:hypothetical protein